MTYDRAYEYIEQCNSLGSVPGLDSIEELLHRLGDPQDELKFIHIAGTNGKGSTLAYISTVFKAAGFRVGRYISPTISEYLERFDIGGRHMSRKAFAEYIDRIRTVCAEMVADGHRHPTSFEIETAMAFLYFRDKRCDIVVLECGMGGRLDATNVVKTTVIEVFAHIALDHMQYLGDTIEAIATEKAGIIKPGTAVVSGIQSKEALDVIRAECKKSNAKLYELAKDDVTYRRLTVKGTDFAYCGRKFRTPLLGVHQIYNAALAIKAIDVLKDRMPDVYGRINDDVIRKGLDQTVWPGRLQILSVRPYVIIDGAHNPDGALRLKEAVDLYFKDKRKLLIMGMLKDKDINAVADIMCRDADMVFTVTPCDNPRALRSVDLAHVVREYNTNVTSLDSVAEAVEMAGLCADDKSVIIAFGSLSFMGRMIELYGR